MKSSSDLPGRSRRPRNPNQPAWLSKGRIALFIVAAIVLVLFLSARTLANFYVDLLWFRSVERGSVFWTSIKSKLFLGAVFSVAFAIVSFISLTLAERLSPKELSNGPEREVVERFKLIVGRRTRLLRIAVSVLFGLLVGLPAMAQWQDWLLFKNSQSFGTNDPLFGVDVGFYIFRLPFLTFMVDWAFAAVVMITILTAVMHFLNGSIRVQTAGDRISKGARIHLSVLFSILAVIKAADYWLQRFELTVSSRGVVQGATYTDVNAQLPAINLLILVSLLVAALFLAGIRFGGWRLPLLSMALWAVVAVVAGTVYPAVIQRFVVQPNVTTREYTYIGRNVTATRAAMGIDKVETISLTSGTVTDAEVAQASVPLADSRLLDVTEMKDRYSLDQGLFAFYAINDLDVDRYDIGGRSQQTMVAARELNPDGIPNKTWVSKHLIYTHGCGVVSASASQITSDGRPIYSEIAAEKPQLYVGTKQPGYAIVNTKQVEQACPDTAATPYGGKGGVVLDSTVKKLAYAIHFGEFNLFGSSLITEESRLINVRDVSERVSKVAPFLHLDADPYPVVDGGKVQWVIDAFTTTSRYPYAQEANTDNLTAGSGLKHNFNYVRNSVKAVVDAYDGSVVLYVVDPTDPIVRAWSKAFPGLFTSADQVPATLRAHFRYPEDLFRVQTNLYGRYQFTDTDAFFNRDSAWSVAQAAQRQPEVVVTAAGDVTAATGATSQADTGNVADANVARFEPYYTLFHAPDTVGSTAAPTFSLIRPFVPFSSDDTRKELRAFMVVSSDPETYGQLKVYKYDGTLPAGPATVSAELSSNPSISPVITLLNQQGSRVILGQLQVVPVGKGLIWVQPLYIRPDEAGSKQVFVRRVLAWYDGEAVIGDTLSEAINRLFPKANLDLGEVVKDAGTDSGTDTEVDTGTDTGTDPGTVPETDTSTTDPVVLLEDAQTLFDEADVALRDGDLGTYQSKVDEAQALIAKALAQLNA